MSAQRIFGRVLRIGGVSSRVSVRPIVFIVAVAALLVGLGAVAVTLGEYPISIGQILAAIGGDGSDAVRRIVVEGRLPRIVLAVIAGAALGVSGAVFQSVTRNPLGSPDIIGFTSGSFTGALVVILVVGGNYLQIAGGALFGGLVTALVVYALAYRRGGVHGYRLIVVGIAASFFLQAINGWLIIRADLNSALAAASWGAGSFNLVDWRENLVVAAVIVLTIPALLWSSRRLRVLELGDDAAIALGVSAERTRIVSLLAAIALVAVVTAAVGPVAFIALAAPQIAKRMTGSPSVVLIPAAMTGALLTLGSDIIAQRLLAPTQLPVGIVTVVVGGVYLVALLISQARRSSL
ncbi:iron complex transport system permease protein [Salinibacterium sp. CAN_S4]|uniref:FecCD family ABC transporter permease n=1 Tax=Salinibacterium sp. CAN_S4 TaxID=2787727 RepID=UPI0018EF7684